MSLSTVIPSQSDLNNTLEPGGGLDLDKSGIKVDLCTLPDDVLLRIITHIPVKGIVTLRQTSKRFCGLTNSRWTWIEAFKRDVLARGLPLPATYAEGCLDALTTQTLESHAVAVAQFNDNWYSPKARLRVTAKVTAFTPLRPNIPTDIYEINFLKGSLGEFCVAIAGETIVYWKIPHNGSSARCVASWTHAGGIGKVVVNDDPEHPLGLVYINYDDSSPRTGWVWVLILNKTAGSLRPYQELRVPRECRLFAMFGDFIVFGSPTSVLVWHVTGKEHQLITKLRNHLHTEMDEVLAIKKVKDHIVVVRTRLVEIYTVPVLSSERQQFSTLGRIISVFRMASEPAREAVIAVRLGAEESPSSPPPVAIIVLRADNTLAQFDLLPASSPPSRDGRPPAPYDMSREPTRVFQVSPSACQLKVTQYGKGIWMQKEKLSGSKGEYLVQCVVGFDVFPPFHDLPPNPSSTPNQCGVSLVTDNFRPGGASDADLRVCQYRLYSRSFEAAGDILVAEGQNRVTAAAVDDSVGRLVIGDRSGKIRMLNFV